MKEVTLQELLYQSVLDSFTDIFLELKSFKEGDKWRLEYGDLYCLITEDEFQNFR